MNRWVSLRIIPAFCLGIKKILEMMISLLDVKELILAKSCKVLRNRTCKVIVYFMIVLEAGSEE
jgi:hypothetical protein